ncbi:unnamed protein product [Bathycoccus prasinos]
MMSFSSATACCCSSSSAHSYATASSSSKNRGGTNKTSTSLRQKSRSVMRAVKVAADAETAENTTTTTNTSAAPEAASSASASVSSAAAATTEKPEPELKSDMGVDYAPFRDLLKSGEWEKADDEHRRLMCVLAGEDAEDREWVYFTEVKNMPVTDLKTIDALWSHFSGGRYGFAIQRKLWVAQKRNWAKFFKKIDWTTGENGDYRKFPNEFLWRADAAPGHMPLTNALRGTQLFEALMEHPAFAPPKTAAEIQAEELAKVQDQVTGAVSRAQGEFGDLMRKGLKGLKKPDWMS